MNQYPAGLVPMMVPQPYMMAVRLPQGVQPQRGQTALGQAGLSQAALGQAAMVSQAALGQTALSQAGLISQSPMGQTGVSPALVAQAAMGQTLGQTALGQTALGQTALGQTALGQTALGQGALGHGAFSQAALGQAALSQSMYGQAALGGGTALGHSAFLPGLPLAAAAAQRFAATPTHGGLQALSLTSAGQGLTPQPQMLQLDPNAALKLAYADGGRAASLASMYGMSEMVQHVEEASEKSIVMLDDYNSDLHLVLDDDGYGARPLSEPSAFCFCWAGVKATHGVYRGKAYYEIQVTEHQQTDFGTDHQEKDPHIIRVGWSLEECSLQLGEEPYSYGYGGTGRFSQNCKFGNYGEKFGQGDVIGALLDMDTQPPTISYMKNGQWLGIAHTLHGFTPGIKEKALFPHILTKNSRFRMNLGQEGTWYPPPQGYNYVQQVPEKIKSMDAPEKKNECEMIMIIGLPGAGKTTLAENMKRSYPEKRYNIIGTDTLIDKMKVMGLPRKNNYNGRWEVLIDKATKALNKLFEIAKNKNRNYILDQTNVYPSARKRKMKNFSGFFRRAMILQPEDSELTRRAEKRTAEDGKFVPESAVLEMKSNFKLPDDNDPLYDSIEYVELQKRDVQALVERYNNDGASRGQPGRFGQKPFQPPADMRQGGSYTNQASNAPPLPQTQYGDRFQQSAYIQGQDYGQQGRTREYERQGKHASSGGRESEPQEKRGRYENSGSSSALDLLKQEYEDDEPSQPPMAAFVQGKEIKQEPQWPRAAAPFAIDPQQLNAQSLLGLPPGHLLAGQPVAFGGSNLQLIGPAGLAGAAERAAVIPGYGQAFAHAAASQPELVKGLQEKRNLAEAALRAEAANALLAQQTAASHAHLAETLKNWQNQNQQQSNSRPSSRGGYSDQQGRGRPHSNPSHGAGFGRSNDQFSFNQNQSARDHGRPGSADQRDSYGRGKNGNSGNRSNYGQDSNQNQYNNSDYDKNSDSSQNNDKPRRERKRPSKWDNPEDTNATAAAESGVSQEVMAKVQAIQQSIQRQHEQQESQASEGGPSGGPSDEGNKQDNWHENQDNNQFPGNFMGPMGPRMDGGGFLPQRGGFGGRPPRPMMGRGGPPGQRPPPPFRPPGLMGDRFPRPDGFPPRPDGFGGPRFGGRGPPPDQRFGGPGRGGPPGPPPGGPPGPPPPGGPPPGPPFRPRGPPDQGGMRGGRPPFGGRGPPPFGGRGGGMQMRPRGGPPGGRWPRP